MSERAMLSDGEARVDELAYRYETCLGDGALAAGVVAGMARDEAHRILAETEPDGGAVARVRLSSAQSCRYLGHETSMMALAEALAAFVGDAQ